METDQQARRCKQTKKRKVHAVKAVFLFAIRHRNIRCARACPRATDVADGFKEPGLRHIRNRNPGRSMMTARWIEQDMARSRKLVPLNRQSSRR